MECIANINLIRFLGLLFLSQSINGFTLPPQEAWSQDEILDALSFAAEIRSSSPDSALMYAEDALQNARETHFHEGVAKALSSIGRILMAQKKYEHAISYLDSSLLFRRKYYPGLNGIAVVQKYMGVSYSEKAQYSRAVGYLLSAVQTWRELEKWRNLSGAYSDLGNVYKKLGERERKLHPEKREIAEEDSALKYFRLSIKLDTQQAISINYANTCNNVSALFLAMKQPDSALHYLNMAEQLFASFGDNFRKALSAVYGHKGTAFTQKQEYDSAKYYYQADLQLNKALNDLHGQMIAHNNLGFHFSEASQYSLAQEQFLRAVELEDSLKLKNELTRILYSNLSEVYDSLGNKNKALDYFRQSFELKNALSLAETKNHLSDAIEKVELENQTLQQQQQNKQQQIWLITLASSAILITIILLLIARYFYQRQKFQRLLNERQQQKHQENIISLMKQTEQKILSAQNEGQEKLLRHIGRELHDDLGGMMTASKRELENLRNSLGQLSVQAEKRYEHSLQTIGNTISKLRKISHDLSSLSLQNGLLPALKDMVYELNEAENQLKVELHSFQLEEKSLPSNVELNVFRIIQEAITNILKHARADQVSLQLIHAEDSLSVSIEDNGVGFEPLESKSGLGLHSISSRTQELGGQLTVDSKPGRGTSIFVEIPLTPQL